MRTALRGVALALPPLVPLPLTLAPPAPFPLVTSAAATRAFVAPGVSRADYIVRTSSGPLAIHVVAFDPREPTLRITTVLAHDRLASEGETISSMARRTGAVAGINADYFDIGNTNQPVGIVVRDGTLVRSPYHRIAFAVTRAHEVRFLRFGFGGTAAWGTTSVPLTGVNVWPPQGGAALLGPVFGALAPAPGVTLALLAPGSSPGLYRVTALAPAAAGFAEAPVALALGPAVAASGFPAPGDAVTVAADTTPSAAGIESAAGGGALVLADGTPVDDADAPRLASAAVRAPLSAAARRPDGTVLFIDVDGRRPEASIGVSRPEMAALMRALGATDGMTFDSGGSATLVARVLGDRDATVLGVPSDGAERPVSDGLFLESDAPLGPAARLVARPSQVVALAGATVAPGLLLADAAGHPLGAAPPPYRYSASPAGLAAVAPDGFTAGATPGIGSVGVAAAGLQAVIPLTVVDRVARVAIVPARPNPDPGGSIAFRALAFDAAGRPVETGGRVRWTASGATVTADGTLRAGSSDASVTANVGGVGASEPVPVGRHAEAVALEPAPWQLAILPAASGATGAVQAGTDCDGCLALAYDFTAGGVAVSADGAVPLRGAPLAFSADVRGDGGGGGVRAAFVDAAGVRFAVTLAKAVDWSGWQRRSAPIPDGYVAPLRLISLYAVSTLSPAGKHAHGTLEFRGARVLVTGSSSSAPE